MPMKRFRKKEEDRFWAFYREFLKDKHVLDCHNHIGYDKDGSKQNNSQLIKSMDFFQIDKSVIFPFNDPNPGTSFNKANERIYKSFSKHPEKFIPFMRLNPHEPQWKSELELRYSQGFKGIKLHPRSQDFIINDSELFQIYGEAEDKKLTVIIHCGFMPNLKITDAVINIVDNYKNLNLILAHAAFVDIVDVIYKLKNYNNVLFDSSIAPVYDVYELIYQLGSERIVYGSDTPYGDISYSIQSVVDVITSLNLPLKKQKQILGENLQRCIR